MAARPSIFLWGFAPEPHNLLKKVD